MPSRRRVQLGPDGLGLSLRSLACLSARLGFDGVEVTEGERPKNAQRSQAMHETMGLSLRPLGSAGWLQNTALKLVLVAIKEEETQIACVGAGCAVGTVCGELGDLLTSRS